MDFDVRSYDCGYCGRKFEEASPSSGGGQIRCPRCQNFLKVLEGIFVKTVKAKTFLQTRGHK